LFHPVDFFDGLENLVQVGVGPFGYFVVINQNDADTFESLVLLHPLSFPNVLRLNVVNQVYSVGAFSQIFGNQYFAFQGVFVNFEHSVILCDFGGHEFEYFWLI